MEKRFRILETMKNLENFSKIFLVLGLLGLLDAAYLTAQHYIGAPIICGVGHGCDYVLSSEYSTLFGIPIALFGMAFYFSVVVLAAAYIDTKNILFLKLIAAGSTIAFLISMFLVYIQAFVIGQFCTYCLTSATISTLLFISSIYVIIKTK